MTSIFPSENSKYKELVMEELLQFLDISKTDFDRIIRNEMKGVYYNTWRKSKYSDFSLYKNKEYVVISYYSFLQCSEISMRNIENSIYVFNDSKTILDYGAGIGLSTIFLKDIFRNRKVYYYNIESRQKQFFKYLIKKYDVDITVLETENDVFSKTYDFVFCSEVLEHLHNFKPTLNNICKSTTKHLICTGWFGKIAFGHYPEYEWDNSVISAAVAKKKMENFIISQGFYLDRFLYYYAYFNHYPRVYHRCGGGISEKK